MPKRVNIGVFSNLLKQCLAPTNEQVLLIGDNGLETNKTSVFLTQAFSLACEELGLRYETVYQNTKTRGEPADAVVINKIKKLPKKSIIMVNVSNRLGSMKALGYSFRNYVTKQDHRFTSASTLGPITPQTLPYFIQALDVNYASMQKRTEKLKKILDNGTEVHVSTKAGTDVTMNITDMESRSSTGVYTQPGTGGNLPGAEAYIAPKGKGVEGTIVIDGSTRLRNGSRMIRRNGNIKLTVENGSIVNINKSPEAKELEKTLKWAHRKSSHPWGVRRIGELGIGTNEKARIIGATILDEKVLGTAHFAIGSNHWFGGSIYSIIHLDQVVKDPIIRVNGKLIKV